MTYAEHGRHVHYVTARSDTKTALLAGPFRNRRAAEAVEPQLRELVRREYAHDIEATFAGIGTARVTLRPGAVAPAGALNDRLGIVP